MRRVVILIPTLNPLSSFVQFVKSLYGYKHILIINDGSEKKYEPIFNQIRTLKDCTVLTNEGNFGKGFTIKRGIQHIQKHWHDCDGILTVGAHGQHSLKEVERVLTQRKVFSDGIILGVRVLHEGSTSKVNLWENKAANILFELLFRKKLLDTQTGLRYLPKTEWAWLMKVQGEHANYDINMLIEAIRRDVPIYEVPIGHARIRANSMSGYDELIDGRKILRQIWTSFFKNHLSN